MNAAVAPPQQLEAWVGFLRSHAAITRQLNVDLLNAHGLTLNDYEVMLHLARAEGGLLRRVDLAERVVLTASGITRLLDGLERAGYVERASCPSDARVSYAKLTDAGQTKLQSESLTQLAGGRELFAGRFGNEALDTLARVLTRLPMAGKPASGAC